MVGNRAAVDTGSQTVAHAAMQRCLACAKLRLLVAVGRRPNGKMIGAEAAGITVDDRGCIPVDQQLRTNISHIFAIGDIVGQPMLAHNAVHEGTTAAEVAAGRNSFFDVRVIPLAPMPETSSPKWLSPSR